MPPLPSNREWIYWGEHDPLYGVSTRRGKEIGGADPWTPEEFLETGRRYFADVALHWKRYGMGTRHCVEIGCGAGRITRQLADCYEAVTAIDVSPAQIELARGLLGAQAHRVTFALVKDPVIPVADAVCDGVFSCEVFQHLDSQRAVFAYFREAHRVLVPGGTLCIQVPVKGMQPRTLTALPLRNTLLRFLRRLGRQRMMIYRTHEAPRVLNHLVEIGFTDVELQLFHAEEQDGFHPYFMARKAG